MSSIKLIAHFKTISHSILHCVIVEYGAHTVPPLQGPMCTKCSRPTKGHALPYGVNCCLAPIEEALTESRDILSSKEDIHHGPEVPHLCNHSVPRKPEDAMGEPVVPADMIGVTVAEHRPEALPLTAPASTALPDATMALATIATASNLSMALTECNLANNCPNSSLRHVTSLSTSESYWTTSYRPIPQHPHLQRSSPHQHCLQLSAFFQQWQQSTWTSSLTPWHRISPHMSDLSIHCSNKHCPRLSAFT